jgi:peptide/nickel transport system substrate-binding protein
VRKKRRSITFGALLLALSLVAAACGGDGDGDGDGGGPSGEATKGGTYRISAASFEFTAGFDPSAEYLGDNWAYYTNLLLRNLVTYKHLPGDEGNVLVPDLAEEIPEVPDDATEYTFTLKDGIKFAPPVDREITSADFVYAFERIGTKSVAAQYPFYYLGTIEGLQEFYDGKADEISGIETPDDKTITFKLTQPTGDFLYRLAMPAAAPVPPEVGKCFEKAGEYGQHVVSSGPYMFEGSDELDASSCNTLEVPSGMSPEKFMYYDRNPNYDPDTDSPEVRENNPDRFEITINTNTDDIFAKIEAGELEGTTENAPSEIVRKYVTDEKLKDLVDIHPGDRINYITMNLTQPPFDDIHVRKAANLVMDKDALRRAWGGPTAGEIATHAIPPGVGELTAEDYNPYETPNNAGDEEAAKAEMEQSKYDTDGDGVCDAPECSGILHLTDRVPPYDDMVPVIEESLAKIGLELETRQLSDSYPPIQTPSKQVPIASRTGWGKDYPDPITIIDPLFNSASILEEGNTNYSLVGITPEIAKDIGVEGEVEDVPNIDADIEECSLLTDQERVDCFIDVDKKLMEEVVPWIPYLWLNEIHPLGPGVAKFVYDQFPGEGAWSKVAVDESGQEGLN